MASTKLARSREHTGDRRVDSIQARIDKTLAALNACPFIFGREIPNQTFTAGVDKTISHGLERRPRGVLVLRDYGANVCTGVGESTTQPNDTTKQINLRSPVTCTVDLWIW